MEQLIIYGSVGIFSILVVIVYLVVQKKTSSKTLKKINEAKAAGLHEPVSLHPVVDPNTCIKTGACISACPEKDILGIYNGKATVINASQCIGHGACFHACPTEAITLCIGTEKRGVDLPHVSKTFETNVPGIFIAGEMGGMGLIRNATVQGSQAMENIAAGMNKKDESAHDVIIIGMGPAGIAASLMAKKLGLSSLSLEQNSLGGTVFTFPRSKIVMTAPMNLPLVGKVKLYETSKQQLLDLWLGVLEQQQIKYKENIKVDSISKNGEHFVVSSEDGQQFTAKKVLLAIGRRGSPRKLNIPGETSEKVAYRLIEPELVHAKKALVVGGGDSAVEAALALANENEVKLSYRRDSFSRIKPGNRILLNKMIEEGKMEVLLNSNLLSIEETTVTLEHNNIEQTLPNDLVYIFAGGELPTEFLKKTGITITRKFGDAILKHD